MYIICLAMSAQFEVDIYFGDRKLNYQMKKLYLRSSILRLLRAEAGYWVVDVTLKRQGTM